MNFQRRGFRLFNKLFMVPMFQLGLGAVMGNQISGYIMLLKTTGRKTGKIRYSPVNYAIHKGNVYCMAGWGKSTDWYRNISATREIEAILPSGPFYGMVEEVDNLDERRYVLRNILKNAGFAGYFEGFNPFSVTDEELMEKTADKPLLRIRLSGIGSGASDPGGLSWVWTVFSVLLTIMIILFFAIIRR
jgi:deazaflavin-dependent oxidoreductase (nitroreductase family)